MVMLAYSKNIRVIMGILNRIDTIIKVFFILSDFIKRKRKIESPIAKSNALAVKVIFIFSSSLIILGKNLDRKPNNPPISKAMDK